MLGRSVKPPCAFGSGKVGKPWLRMHCAYLTAPAEEVPELPAGRELGVTVVVVVEPTLATPGLVALLEHDAARSDTAPSARKKAMVRCDRIRLMR